MRLESFSTQYCRSSTFSAGLQCYGENAFGGETKQQRRRAVTYVTLRKSLQNHSFIQVDTIFIISVIAGILEIKYATFLSIFVSNPSIY